MTTQMTDGITYEGESFQICGCNGPEFFDPKEHGLNPKAPSTACYRGWVGEYIVTDRLLLRDLYVFHDAGLPVKNKTANGPVIGGVAPTKPESWGGFNCFYKDLNFSTSFSGGLLIASGFVRELAVNMGYHPFLKYTRVIELLFEDGKLLEASDKSSVAQEIREKHLVPGFLNRPSLSDDQAVMKWIEDSFSLRYSLVGAP